MNRIFYKIISGITALVVSLFVTSSSLQAIANEVKAIENSIIYGDVNNDKRVDVFDFCLIKQKIVNSETIIDNNAGDVNGDGIININDAREIQQFLLRQRDSFSITERNNITSIDTSIVSTNQPIETSVTVEMAAKADELGNALAVYNYLYNNMRSEFYYGSRKGAIGAYEQGGGNDTDLSSLLISMLRYLGYDANYVTSIAGFSEEQLLRWTNTDSIDIAQSIYTSQGRETAIQDVNGIKYYLCDYKYVQVIDDGNTYYLDIFFKEYENQSTIYDDIDDNYKSTNIQSIIDNTDLDILNTEINEITKSVEKFTDGSYSFNSNKIVQKNVSTLSTNHPHIYDIEPTISDSLTNDENDIVTLSFNNKNGVRIRVVDLYKRNITISYEVSSASKENGEWLEADTSSIFTLPYQELGQVFSVTPIIKVDGQKVFSGSSLNIGDTQKLNISINSGGTTTTYTEELSAGEMVSIVFDLGQISSNELAEAYSNSLKSTETVNQKNGYTYNMANTKLNENNIYSAEYLGSLLHLTGVMYFSQLDISSKSLAERNNIYSENAVRFGVFGFKPNVYTGAITINQKDGIQKDGQYFVDILSNGSRNISKTNNSSQLRAYNFSRGLISSELESSVIEEVLNVESLSTVSIFRYAQENNIPIVTLSSSSEEKVSDLSISSDDAKRIQSEIDAGKIVITTQSNVKLSSWSGIGYIVMPSDGTTQEYMISGGYKGGITFDPVGLYYTINVALDLAMIAESISILIGMLTAMSTLAIVPVALVLLAAVSTAMLIFDIFEQSFLYYEYEFENDIEAGMKIWATTATTSVITLATMGFGKCVSKFSENVSKSRLTSRYGTFVIENIQETGGFTISEINSKVKQFSKLGMSQSTIDTLLQNPKYMMLGDDILSLIGKQGGNQRLLAELVINNGDDFTKAVLNTNVLDDFCSLALKYNKSSISKVLTSGDDAIKFIQKYEGKENINNVIECFNSGNVIGVSKLSTSLASETPSSIFTFATDKTGRTFVAGSGNYQINPTINIEDNYFDDILEYTGTDYKIYYFEKYNNLFSKDYINQMNVNESIKTELYKLSDAINYTKEQAKKNGGFDYGAKYLHIEGIEYSFRNSWSVTNCGEIWSAREAILNGSKFDELTFKSIYSTDGKDFPMCKNCQYTFIEYFKYIKSLGEAE